MQLVWLDAVLTFGCLLVGLFHVARLIGRSVGSNTAAEASHAVMGFGMAAMFSPVGDPVPAPVWTGIFALSAVWFTGLALRCGFGTCDAGHHVVGSGAMLFMLFAGVHEHGGEAGPTVAAGVLGLVSVVAIVLTGYFGWYVLRCGDRVLIARRAAARRHRRGAMAEAAGPNRVAVRRSRRAGLHAPEPAALAQLAMTGAMIVMLLPMV
ncbi:DUF5134 domain-containing protein [Pseudonocardia asaccharolytica]|uniref:DUF5134 domain-containing protein n=1 Tax=Pseudonocardia asaccharolytica DSM 44247 = NBRC 16224 TaxID=1123024 RepID=A0A511D0E2_9PSEU|nr:DUF5134 domain-containing protein [Pseudonocardia asaccharolytica]GEL18269.1 hypothetical protein PA7_21060 [Pseudonocardia asaccharolytica DSM 44247 = NBRC 16224]